MEAKNRSQPLGLTLLLDIFKKNVNAQKRPKYVLIVAAFLASNWVDAGPIIACEGYHLCLLEQEDDTTVNLKCVRFPKKHLCRNGACGFVILVGGEREGLSGAPS